MKRLKLFEEFTVYEMREFGCVMLSVPLQWETLSHSIKAEDIYDPDGNYGISKDPHVTVLYGLHDWEILDEEVESALRSFDAPKMRFGKVSLFENADFDVVKIEVVGDELHEMNARFVQFPHTNKYPVYKPHVTIAYVNKGCGDKYTGCNIYLPDWEMTLNDCVYSKSTGRKNYYKLDGR